MKAGTCTVIQSDVARVGGITPWLKIAHIAETLGVSICRHFLMELQVSLCATAPNARWLEYIPQLDHLTTSRIRIEDGYAIPLEAPGIGISISIEWDWKQIERPPFFTPLVVD